MNTRTRTTTWLRHRNRLSLEACELIDKAERQLGRTELSLQDLYEVSNRSAGALVLFAPDFLPIESVQAATALWWFDLLDENVEVARSMLQRLLDLCGVKRTPRNLAFEMPGFFQAYPSFAEWESRAKMLLEQRILEAEVSLEEAAE